MSTLSRKVDLSIQRLIRAVEKKETKDINYYAEELRQIFIDLETERDDFEEELALINAELEASDLGDDLEDIMDDYT